MFFERIRSARSSKGDVFVVDDDAIALHKSRSRESESGRYSLSTQIIRSFLSNRNSMCLTYPVEVIKQDFNCRKMMIFLGDFTVTIQEDFSRFDSLLIDLKLFQTDLLQYLIRCYF